MCPVLQTKKMLKASLLIWVLHLLVACSAAVPQSKAVAEVVSEKPVQIYPALDKLGGDKWSPELILGRPALIVFMTSWCESCVFTLKRLEEMQGRADGQGFALLGVLMVEPNRTKNSTAWIAQWSDATRVLTVDSSMSKSLRRSLGLSGLPSVGLFDDKGTLVELFEGEPPTSYLVKRARLLAKEPI